MLTVMSDSFVPGAHGSRVSRLRAAVWTSERIAAWEQTGIRPAVTVWTAAQTASS
jgi:hypothetical protein